MAEKERLISKSNYLNGLQCPKLLWYEYNRKQDVRRDNPMTQFVFSEGKKVGLLAQKLFPDGIKLERIPNARKHAEASTEALKLRKPLFEAGFISGNMYALADILAPADDDE